MTALETAFWHTTGITPNALSLPIKTVLSVLLVTCLLVVTIAGYQSLMSASPNVLGFLFLLMRAGIYLSVWSVLIG